MGVLAGVLVVAPLGGELGSGDGVMEAGFSNVRVGVRKGDYEGVHPSRGSAGVEGKRVLSIRQPSAERGISLSRRDREITVSKSNAKYDVDFGASRTGWKHLTRSVRKQIDSAEVRRSRWRSLVVHNSATDRGNAKVFDYYHRQVKGMEEGLAYHFVIGNGTYTGVGEIEVGKRWLEQLGGGPMGSGEENGESIGICLVGDFNKHKVEEAQLEALDELVDYLRAKVGAVRLTTHKTSDGRPTSCPGQFFPEYVLEEGR